MNALHKVAWIELTVSLSALLAVLALYPWMGDRAAGAFGLLGFLGICPLFMIGRKNEVLSDERDRNIELRSKLWGCGTAWLFLSLSLLAIAMWHTWSGQEVPAKYCTTLVCVGFAICYGAQGAYSIVCYRSGQRAT